MWPWLIFGAIGLFALSNNKEAIGSTGNQLIITDHSWDGKTVAELKMLAKDHFTKHFQGKTVYNKSKGIEVILASSGLDHTIYHNTWSIENFISGKHIDKVIETAVFISTGKPKTKDSQDIKGYYNFQNIIVINGKNVEIKITIRVVKRKQGKILRFYYDHYEMK
jgi:hypothetical protein